MEQCSEQFEVTFELLVVILKLVGVEVLKGNGKI